MFPKENKINFRNSHVDWTKVTVLWAEGLDIWTKVTNLWKTPMCLFMSLFPAYQRREAGGGREQSGKRKLTLGSFKHLRYWKERQSKCLRFGSRAFVLSLSFINWSKVTLLLAEALFMNSNHHGTKDTLCPTTVYKGSHWRLPNWQGSDSKYSRWER